VNRNTENAMHTERSIKELLDRSLPAVIRGLQKIQEHTGFKPEHDAPMRKFIAMFERGERLTFRQEKYARSVAKHQAQLLADLANAAGPASMPVTAIIPSVSADAVRYAANCKCEDYDGEQMCEWCQEAYFTRLIQQQEANEERLRMDRKFGVERGAFS